MSDDITDQEPEATKPRSVWLDKLSQLSKRKWWNSSQFMSLLAFLISMGTFLTFTYQTYLIQKQQSASVLPYLRIDYGSGSDYFRIDVSNNGVGPAFVQDFVINYRDSTYRMSLSQFAYQIFKPDSTVNYSTSSSSLGEGYAISSKESVEVLASNNAETAKLLKTLFFDDGLMIEIVYSSVFEEEWKLTSKSYIPEKIDY